MDLLALTEKEERLEGPGEGAEAHCRSGRVVSVVGEARPAALSGDSRGNFQSLTAESVQRKSSICDLKSEMPLSCGRISELFFF